MDLTQYDWLSRFSYRIECLLSKFADQIIVNSNAGMDYATAKGFPKEKMKVIQNGIDTNRFYPDSNSKRMFREEFGVKENEWLIGLIGRIDPMKDHLTFLKAASLLLKEQNNVKFICVGDGPSDYFQKLLLQCEHLNLTDHIIWAGKRDDMNQVYNAIDILTSTSLSEGFSNVIGEAMACGVPCVVTNVGDSAQIVGDLGRVAPPNNPIAIVDEWKEVIKTFDPNDINMALRIRQRIVDHFSEQALIKKTSNVLVNLLEAN
jgi:glycosyltransferase involved in cell wall biosynthesis